MARILDTSDAQISFDMGLQSASLPLFESLVRALIYHEHALEGIVLDENDLERALGHYPVRTEAERDIHRSIYVMYHVIWVLFEKVFSARRLFSQLQDLPLEPVPAPPWGEIESDDDTFMSRLTLDYFYLLVCSRGSLLDAVNGKVTYRTRGSSVGVYNLSLVDATEVMSGLEELKRSYDADVKRLHPVEVAARLHWTFMHLYPYEEQCPVVGRLLMNAHLLRWQHPPALILKGERASYMEALNSPTCGKLTDQVFQGVQVAARLSKHLLEIE